MRFGSSCEKNLQPKLLGDEESKALLPSERQIRPGGAGCQRGRASPEPAQAELGLECKKRCKGMHRQKLWEEGEGK